MTPEPAAETSTAAVKRTAISAGKEMLSWAATKEKLATEASFAEAPPPTYRRTVAAGSEVVLAAGRRKVGGAPVVWP